VSQPPADAYELGPEHQAFQRSCHDFVVNKLLPLVPEAERTGSFPAVIWPELSAAGLLGVGHPEEYGGSGGDTLAIALLAEELAGACGGLAVTILVSAYMAAPHLSRYGSAQLKERYLRPILDGKKVAAIAVTEPAAGSDVAGIRTVARPAGDGYVLTGSKTFITNGQLADVVLVAAKTDPAGGHQGITLFAVEPGTPGFAVGQPFAKMGWHSSDTRELFFEDCHVSAAAIVGEPGRGFHQIMRAFATERIALAGMSIGLAQAALDDALAHAKNREAFGHRLVEHQAMRHLLAEMAVDVDTARLVTYQASCRLDRDDPRARTSVAAAKLVAARIANTVVDRAVQIHGGYGFIEDSRVAMHYRDARILRIGGGTDEIQLEILGKALTR